MQIIEIKKIKIQNIMTSQNTNNAVHVYNT